MLLRNLFLAATLASVAFIGRAEAIPFVTVWTGPDNGTDGTITANLGSKPTGTADASFFYNGPLDWSNQAAQNSGSTGNLFKDFLNIAFITTFSSPNSTYADATAFGNASMSVAGNAFATYMLITDTYTSDTPFGGTVSHDDGVSVYHGVTNIAVLESAGQTVEITGNYTLPAAVNEKITITYVESNGSPSVLKTTYPAPEPGVLALLGSGLLGLGLLGVRHRRQP